MSWTGVSLASCGMRERISRSLPCPGGHTITGWSEVETHRLTGHVLGWRLLKSYSTHERISPSLPCPGLHTITDWPVEGTRFLTGLVSDLRETPLKAKGLEALTKPEARMKESHQDRPDLEGGS